MYKSRNLFSGETEGIMLFMTETSQNTAKKYIKRFLNTQTNSGKMKEGGDGREEVISG